MVLVRFGPQILLSFQYVPFIDVCLYVLIDLIDSDASARELYASALEQRLFADLDLEKRSEVCMILLQAGSEGGEAVCNAHRVSSMFAYTPCSVLGVSNSTRKTCQRRCNYRPTSRTVPTRPRRGRGTCEQARQTRPVCDPSVLFGRVC